MDLDTSCMAVLMDNGGDQAEAARELCEKCSSDYEKDPFFCRDPSFLPSSTPTTAPTTTTTFNCHPFLIAGGKDSQDQYTRSSEEYDPALNQTSPVVNTKENRLGATFCNNFLCGGHPSDRSCEKFDGNSFELLPVSLVQPREFHMCWGLKSGDVILLGGKNSPTTSEVVSANGTLSSPSFNLIDGIW